MGFVNSPFSKWDPKTAVTTTAPYEFNGPPTRDPIGYPQPYVNSTHPGEKIPSPPARWPELATPPDMWPFGLVPTGSSREVRVSRYLFFSFFPQIAESYRGSAF